jgi:hypothetical protein
MSCFGARWGFQIGSFHYTKRVEGSDSRLTVDVIPLGFNATSQTGVQHDGKE